MIGSLLMLTLITLLTSLIYFLSKKIPTHLGNEWIMQAHETIKQHEQHHTLDTLNEHYRNVILFICCLVFIMLVFTQISILRNADLLKITLIMLFSAYLCTISAIDLIHKIIPDLLSLSLMWLGLFFNQWNIFAEPTSAFFGALWGYACLWLLTNTFKLLNKKETLGYGDLKLTAAIGAWVGWQNLPALLMLSSCLGILHWLILYYKNKANISIPFAPSISLAGCFILTYSVYIQETIQT